MNVKDYKKEIQKNNKNCPSGTEWHKAYGMYAIAQSLLAIAESIEKLTKVIQEK